MADTPGRETDALIRRLEERPYDFDFFQAVRRLDCLHPDLPAIGHSRRSAEDPIRFGQEPSLRFAPSALNGFQRERDDRPARMTVNFFGLLGPNGPMPLHITQHARDRILHFSDETFARFLDVFNHRMIAFFYRAWASGRQHVQYERGEADRFAFYLGGLFGVATPAFRNRDAVPDPAKFHYSGRLVPHARPAEGLTAILEEYFGLPTRLEQFIGRWLDIPDRYWCLLGADRDTCGLGTTLVVGARTWDCQQKFRVHLGPMGFGDYERLLPGGQSFERLRDWIRNYVGDELLWDLQLVLRKEEVPRTRLGQSGRLGWTTWLGGSSTIDTDRDDLVLVPPAA